MHVVVVLLCSLVQAEAMCKDLERGFESVKKKFLGVLAYFGEDGTMSSTEFFTTLHKFVQVQCILTLSKALCGERHFCV